MKLHLPARLRSALLACLAVVTPLACTVATGAFVGYCQEMLHHTLHKETSASFLILRLEIWAGTEQQLAMPKTILLFLG